MSEQNAKNAPSAIFPPIPTGDLAQDVKVLNATLGQLLDGMSMDVIINAIVHHSAFLVNYINEMPAGAGREELRSFYRSQLVKQIVMLGMDEPIPPKEMN